MVAKYDIIGLNYAQLRKPDPCRAAAIQQALGRTETVLNAELLALDAYEAGYWIVVAESG